MLAEACGEEVQTITRTAWPEDGLPDLLSRWVERYEPDIVFFVVPSVWVSFPTASLRRQQMQLPGARVNIAGHAARAQVEGPLLIEAWRQSTRGGEPLRNSLDATSTYRA